MNDERLETILIECLEAMHSGTTVDQLLARYPSEVAQLEPALRMAARLTKLDDTAPKPDVQARARAAFLAQAASMRPVSKPFARARWLVRPLVSLVTTVVLLVIVGSGVWSASATSLPGDPLYNVKRSLEGLELSLAHDPVRRVDLEESYAQRRLEEAKAVQSSKRAASLQFSGAVDRINGDQWVIGGIPVQVGPTASVHGTAHVGAIVEVTGHALPGGQIVAERIEVETTEFTGVVEAMNTPVWVIGGKRVLVTSQTQIVGVARLGALAEVHLRMFGQDMLLALKIDFEHQDELQPTPTTQPTATPRPLPTSTPAPTPSATPRPKTKEPEPTAESGGRGTRTPEPTDSHKGPGTPEPTESHGGTRTPEPTESHHNTPEPTGSHEGPNTPEPTESHGGSRTPGPTEPPGGSRTPEPTESPGGSHTPEPTDSHSVPPTPEPTESHNGPGTPEPTDSHEGQSTPEPTDSHSVSGTLQPRPTDDSIVR